MSIILLSEKAGPQLISCLTDKGHKTIPIQRTPSVYEAISTHADIYACPIGGELILAPEQDAGIGRALSSAGVVYALGSSILQKNYPGNVAYNAVSTENYFIHNLKHTDPMLLGRAQQLGLILIDVKQGYTKCNTVIVSPNAFITSDAGIARQLSSYLIDVLLIQNGHVGLSGFPHGFLGGASGKVDDTIFFNGDLSRHPDCQRIISFIEDRGLSAVYFEDYPLEDIGSLISLYLP